MIFCLLHLQRLYGASSFVYMLECVPPDGATSAQAQAFWRVAQKNLGRGFVTDAAAFDAYCHRRRWWCTNGAPHRLLQGWANQARRDPSLLVDDILLPNHKAQPCTKRDHPTLYQANVPGKPLRCLRTFLCFAYSRNFRLGRQGTVHNIKKPYLMDSLHPTEKEAAMRFQPGALTRSPLSDESVLRLIGNAWCPVQAAFNFKSIRDFQLADANTRQTLLSKFPLPQEALLSSTEPEGTNTARRCFAYHAVVNGRILRALLDSGASDCYISAELSKCLGAEAIPITQAGKVIYGSGETCSYTHALRLKFSIGDWSTTQIVKPIKIHGYDLVIGMSFLVAHNPAICWRTGLMKVKSGPRTHCLRAVGYEDVERQPPQDGTDSVAMLSTDLFAVQHTVARMPCPLPHARGRPHLAEDCKLHAAGVKLLTAVRRHARALPSHWERKSEQERLRLVLRVAVPHRIKTLIPLRLRPSVEQLYLPMAKQLYGQEGFIEAFCTILQAPTLGDPAELCERLLRSLPADPQTPGSGEGAAEEDAESAGPKDQAVPMQEHPPEDDPRTLRSGEGAVGAVAGRPEGAKDPEVPVQEQEQPPEDVLLEEHPPEGSKVPQGRPRKIEGTPELPVELECLRACREARQSKQSCTDRRDTGQRRPRSFRGKSTKAARRRGHGEYLQYASDECREAFRKMGVELCCFTTDKQLRGLTHGLTRTQMESIHAIYDLGEHEQLIETLDNHRMTLADTQESVDHPQRERPAVDPMDQVERYLPGGEELEKELKELYPRVFREKAWAVHELPPDVERPIMDLALKPGAVAKCARPIRLTAEQTVLLKETLQAMEQRGLIVRSKSSWGSAAFFIPKTKADSTVYGWRMCVDLRYVNSQLIQDRYNFPNCDAILDQLQGCTKFSALDLSDAWYQIKLKPEDRHIAAISTSLGLWEPTSAIFGLASAPSCWTRWIDTQFAEIRRQHPEITLMVYADDLLIATPGSMEDHRSAVEVIVKKLEELYLVCPIHKMQLFRSSLSYLGHVIDERGRRPHPSKTRAIQEREIPETLVKAQSYLGLVNYYRRFSPRLAQFEAILRSCMKECKRPQDPVSWTPEAHEAFEKIKQEFVSPPILLHPRFDHPYFLVTDASETAMGGFLGQNPDGLGLRPVEYFSKVWDKAQRSWDPRRKEAYAILYGLEKWRHYLLGSQFTVLTDHESLKYLLTQKSFKGRSQTLLRYLEFLSEFNFHVHYIKGEDNHLADYLSRPKQDPVILEARPNPDQPLEQILPDGSRLPTEPIMSLWESSAFQIGQLLQDSGRSMEISSDPQSPPGIGVTDWPGLLQGLSELDLRTDPPTQPVTSSFGVLQEKLLQAQEPTATGYTSMEQFWNEFRANYAEDTVLQAQI